MSNAGDNSVAKDALRAFVERIERLEEEKASIAADIKEVYAELKGTGFDPKIVRMVIKLRKMDPSTRQEQDFLLDTYLHALGMVEGPGDAGDSGEE